MVMATVSMELLVFEGIRFLDLLKTYFGEVQIPVAVFWIGETKYGEDDNLSWKLSNCRNARN